MRKDLALDENGDLKIVNGDFVIEASDTQHVNDIFLAEAGEYKEFPTMGFGATNYEKGIAKESEFKRNLKEQLEADGYVNPIIDLSKGYEELIIKV